MIDRSPTPLFLGENPAAVPIRRAALRAYLALVAALGGAATGAMLILSLAANSGTEAGRIADAQGDGYAATLVSALAVHLSKPSR